MLEVAGFTRQQTEAQAEVIRNAFTSFDVERMKDLATKGDIQLEIEKVRSEIKNTELRLLKWQIGGWLGLAAIMATGFGWLGF